MRRLLTIAAAMAAASLAAGSRSATEKWVQGNFRPMVYTTNECLTVYATGHGWFRVTYDLADQYALMATNSAHATITNGALFAWNHAGAYTNAPLATAITPTATNFVWNGVQSTPVNGIDTFAGHFGVVGKKIRTATAKAVRGEAQ